ncbi:hypothetical protein TNCT_295441 [Trichonephila clavata]|uniref:RNA-directed DNA polymerase n=1 Tax=Trichonephila clavata TaxID=2740835 RepID=A0A8X6JF70_TRICU|nr:hypothetical protein TNCT_295441 [Trichonephila clavata]
MFLMGNSSIEVIDLDLCDFAKFQRRVKFRVKLLKDLRGRFRKEYLGLLVQKAHKTSRAFKVGEIVLIENPNKKRLYWPLGKVIELIPGRGGKVRTLKLRCSNSEIIRPIQRVFPLEIQSAETTDFTSEKSEENSRESPPPHLIYDVVHCFCVSCVMVTNYLFTNLIQLKILPPDFSIVFEVYTLQTKKRKNLPHEKKYHIKRVTSRNLDEHISHLKEIFRRLDENGLVLKISKCIFAKPEVYFLGHHVSASGIRPITERIQAILDFNRPSTVKQLRRFLGMLNFYHRFLPNAAKHQTKLNDFLLGIKKNKNKSIDWDEDSIKAFEYCKEQLSESTTLAHPVSNTHLAIMVDASDKAVGGVMQQYVSNHCQPLAFFSMRLTPTQKRLKSCFFADPDPYKPTLVDKSSTTSTSPSTVSATPHHSQQSTSEQSSKLRVRFDEPPAQYVTCSGRAVHPSKRFL